MFIHIFKVTCYSQLKLHNGMLQFELIFKYIFRFNLKMCSVTYIYTANYMPICNRAAMKKQDLASY